MDTLLVWENAQIMYGKGAPVVLVHGGAGDVPEGRRARQVEGCRRAAEAGLEVVLGGGSALMAAEAAVVVLENDPNFNAGTGASLAEDGSIELDASIMEGTTMRAGAVAVLPPFLNPIRIARAALDDGRHILYAGRGAARFAREMGFSPASLEEMRTEQAEKRLADVKAGRAGEGWAGGTVGAVVLDTQGHVAAATSTGGTVGKRLGRIGDTPLLGAGTYADDAAGAASATGIGETIMRGCLAHAAVLRMREGMSASEAARVSVAELAERVHGSGGVILVDRHGGAGYAWNTETMSHAVARAGKKTLAGC